MAFDASPSWSGFNYQGKVALYHALTLINNDINADLSKIQLTLENIEDFEISSSNSVISLHQVKAYNLSNYSNYSDALLEITLELHKNNNSIGYIHTWKKIDFKKNFMSLEDSVKDDLCFLVSQYAPMPRNGESLIEKATSGKKSLPKTAAILRAAFSNKCAEEIHQILSSILNEKDDSLQRMSTYTYDDGNSFCDLTTINIKIKNEIEKILDKKGKNTSKEQIERTFHYFLSSIDEHISTRHKQKQNGVKLSITLSSILTSIIEDREIISHQYLAIEFKNFFALKLDEFMADEDDYQHPTNDEKCNLSQVRDYLLALTPLELWSFYRSFSPQSQLVPGQNLQNALAVDEIGIRYVLIKIFNAINSDRSIFNLNRFNITYKNPDQPSENYLPTTISNVLPPEKVIRKIAENPNATELLFEVKNIIYSGSEIFPFYPTWESNCQAPPHSDLNENEKQTEPLRIIKLIPIDIAKGILS